MARTTTAPTTALKFGDVTVQVEPDKVERLLAGGLFTESAGARRRTTAKATTTEPATSTEPELFDPTTATVADVTSYLETADDDERARVLDAESARGKKARKGITEWAPADAGA